MRSLVIFYNDTERWIHALTCEVADDGSHTVVKSETIFPKGHLLTYASQYHIRVGVERERTNVFRVEKVVSGNDPTFTSPRE